MQHTLPVVIATATMLSMRSFIAVLLAALLLAAGGAEAKPKACKKFSAAGDQFVWDIVPLCMPNYSLTCTSSCRKHLKKVGGCRCGACSHVRRCALIGWGGTLPHRPCVSPHQVGHLEAYAKLSSMHDVCAPTQVNLKCFSSLIKERMPWRLDGSVRFYKSCT